MDERPPASLMSPASWSVRVLHTGCAGPQFCSLRLRCYNTILVWDATPKSTVFHECRHHSRCCWCIVVHTLDYVICLGSPIVVAKGPQRSGAPCCIRTPAQRNGDVQEAAVAYQVRLIGSTPSWRQDGGFRGGLPMRHATNTRLSTTHALCCSCRAEACCCGQKDGSGSTQEASGSGKARAGQISA